MLLGKAGVQLERVAPTASGHGSVIKAYAPCGSRDKFVAIAPTPHARSRG
jgi:hypothetical protein